MFSLQPLYASISSVLILKILDNLMIKKNYFPALNQYYFIL